MDKMMHLADSERDDLAETLWAAHMGVPRSGLRRIVRAKSFERGLEQWRGVADAAEKWIRMLKSERKLVREAEPVIAPARTGWGKPDVMPAPTDRKHCTQCDRRVSNSDAVACRDKFCKAVVS